MDAQLHQDPSDFSLISGYHPTPPFDEDALIDVSDAAREAGLACSVALSRDAWTLCVAMNPAAQAAGCDERGRLHHVLSMLQWALGQNRRGSRVSFEVPCITHSLRPTCIPLQVVAGSDDDDGSTITLILPEQS
jgi:hypothetical protein